MENKTKAQTFIGFAIRARKCKIGMNALQTLKTIDLMICCKTASDNTKKQAQKIAKKYGCPLLLTTQKTLEQMTFKDNAKVMAVSDKALSKAILDNLENDFIATELGE